MENHRHVIDFYKDFAPEYDLIRDPFFSYWDAFVNNFFIKHLRGNITNKLILDVGCGTGIQTYRVAREGGRPIGFDISLDLLNEAIEKNKGTYKIELCCADATHIPFIDESFDMIISFGSVLSHIPNFRATIKEISRVLKSDGKFLIEVENKICLDLFHEFIDAYLFNGKLYSTKKSTIREHIKGGLKKGGSVPWIFHYQDGKSKRINIWQFTFSEIEEIMEKYSLIIDKSFGIHVFTLIFPSYLLMRIKSGIVKFVVQKLGWLESFITDHFPFNRLGSSLLLVGSKKKDVS